VDFEGPELSTCAPLKSQSHPDFHHHEDYATLSFIGPPKKSEAKPYGIDQRVALTTSKVVGSPDPPPPYRVQRRYPKFEPLFPISVNREPGSDRLLVIVEQSPYGATKIIRIPDTAEVDMSKAETLVEDMDAVAYSIAFHPDFAKNGYVYVGLNAPLSGGKENRKTKIVRYTMSREAPFKLDTKSAKTIIEWLSDGHNGGAMTFGHDRMMYVTSGDGTSDSDTNVAGQKMDSLLSKVLRIDVDHPDPGKEYSVPKDNPFVGQPGIVPETWAYGLRNPWRITTDEKTGHIWVGQNGQDLWEQAYLVHKGDNYGWSVYEGSHPFYPNRKLGPTPHVKPTIEHHHSEFRSLTGGIVYYGAKYPDLQGAYLYGDYSTGKIWGMKHDGNKVLWHRELASSTLHITGFGTDSKGEILICDHRGKGEGALYTLTPTPKDLPPSTFPRKLSESGLFKSVKGHVMRDSLIPYSVNSPLWSDGAYKARWLGITDDNFKIELSGNRGWNFPDKTVAVKSFALEMEEGNPSSRRWIETRFLTKQDDEWSGYSYLWNDEQTDAVLIDAKGMDREYTIRVPRSRERAESTRVQKWHYPSRAECMVCHSRAANFVLGLTELQFNKVHDYGSVQDDQLRTLEHLGLLKVDYVRDTKERMREELRSQGKTDKEIDAYMEKQTATRLQRTGKSSSLLSFAPEKYPRLVDPYDTKADLAARARSYLHANCAQCHVEAGGGNAQMELEFTTALDKMRVLDVKPVHHTFNLPDARLIAPGHPERSVILYRMATREAGFMPPLATSVVDREAVEMLRAWVRELKEPKK
jgi:glucose/arabinose dehydrogenase